MKPAKKRSKPLSHDRKTKLASLERTKLKERAQEGNLLAFTLYTKEDYQVGWHNKLLCKKLDAFIRGEIRFLMVFMPPRTGKSELVSRRLPAHLQGLRPDCHILAASYSSGLANEMTADVQKIMDTDEYRTLFPDSAIVPAGSKSSGSTRSSKGHDIIGHRGKYRGAGIMGAFTGKGAHYVLIDDPFKNRAEADSEVFRQRVWEAYKSALRSRLEKGGQILITLTRWHKDDLAGRIEKEMANDPDFDQFEIFSLPMICEDQKAEGDPRQEGEPLWPEKYDLQECKSLKVSQGSRNWAALYQQRPTEAEGAIIKRAWLQYYQAYPDLSTFQKIIISIDATFKDSSASDYVTMGVWGKKGAQKFLLDQVRDRMSFTETCRALKALAAKWPRARAKYLEDKANGSAIENLMKKTISGIILVEPEGSKDARLEAVSPQFEAGNVFIPDPSLAVWVNDYVEELVSFPAVANDDQVDQTSQALLKLEDSKSDLLKALSSW